MAFSSEIRYKIGADTSALSKAFIQAQSIAAAAGQQIHKKLGMKDAFKGMMQGIGINSVDSISSLVVAPFKAAAEEAKLASDQSEKLLEIQRRAYGQIGGPQRELEIKKKTVRDMNVDIEMQSKLVNELDTPMKWINPAHAIMLHAERQELSRLVTTQAQLHAEVRVTQELDKKRASDIGEKYSDENHLIDMQADKKSKLLILEKQLENERRKGYKLFREKAMQSEMAENLGKQMNLMAEIRLLRVNMQTLLTNQTNALGASASTKKPIKKPRGRTESERLADRGAGFLAQAEEAMLHGQSPAYVKSLADAGSADMAKAGRRLKSAGAMLDENKQYGKAMLDSAASLKNIEKNVSPEKIK